MSKNLLMLFLVKQSRWTMMEMISSGQENQSFSILCKQGMSGTNTTRLIMILIILLPRWYRGTNFMYFILT